MKTNVYLKEDADGNYIRTYQTNAGWEIEISYKGKALKYGASSCDRALWKNKKEAIEVVDDAFGRGIATIYAAEHKRQFGY